MMFKNPSNQFPTNPPVARAGGDHPDLKPCDRRDLAAWSAEGGPLPARLAAHVADCPGCARHVRRLNQVHASLMLLSNQPLPANLHARANGRALRMLRRVTRASAAASRLLRMRPDLTPWQRIQVHLTRASMSAAAAVLVFMMRAGVLSGVKETQAIGQTLASAHWDRHIDPNGEWIQRQA